MQQPPEIKPMDMNHLALPVETVMPNGVSLYHLSGGCEAVVRLDILFKGGYSVQEKPLQALFTNRMLREGSESRSATEISEKLDYYGAWIDMYSSQECNHITLYALPKHFPALLPVVEDFIKHPTFPQENLEVVCRNNRAHFLVNSRKVDAVAQRHFEQVLWGEEHPLGHIVEPCDYDNISRGDLLEYYAKVYSSRNCTLFLSGCGDEDVTGAVRACFGCEEWGSAAPVVIDVPAARAGRGTRNVPMENVVQSAVKVGCPAPSAGNPDIYDFRFLNVLLGGFFGGRLMSNIREENGYTYDIFSEIDAYGKDNAFMISSQAASEYVEPLLREVYGEIERLRNEEPPVEEVELVRNYILGELCREYEGIVAKAEVFVNAWLSGESFEGVNRYIDAVKKITPARLREVACKYLVRDNMFEIIVG